MLKTVLGGLHDLNRKVSILPFAFAIKMVALFNYMVSVLNSMFLMTCSLDILVGSWYKVTRWPVSKNDTQYTGFVK